MAGGLTRTGALRVAAMLMLLASWGAARAADIEPRGRLVWSKVNGNEFSLHTVIYGPTGDPMQSMGSEVVVPSPGSVVAVDLQTKMFSPNGNPLQKSGQVAADSPAGEFHFLHPTFDFTGMRMLWAGGSTWVPDNLPGSTVGGSLSEGPRVYFGEPDNAVTAGSGSGGGVMDAFPFADPQARWVYFARYHYEAGSDVPIPGWYLMRFSREALEAGGTVTPEALEGNIDGSSTSGPILGSEPFVNSTGQYLLYTKPDAANLSRDIWYLNLTEDPLVERKLWEAEGQREYTPPRAGDRVEAWLEHADALGKARISHPVMSADGRVVVFSCDRGPAWDMGSTQARDWDLYALKLRDTGGDPAAPLEVEEEVRLDNAAQAGVDETWPSLSGDGYWVVYTKRGVDSNAPSLELLQILDERGELTRSGDTEPVQDGDGGLWPQWDQDEDPPHLMVKLQVNDGSPPLVLRIKDQDPDSSAREDAVTLSLQFRNYNPAIPPAPAPAPAGLEELDFMAEKSVTLRYDTQEEDLNSFLLLLAGDRTIEGDGRDIGAFRGFADEDRTRDSEPVLTPADPGAGLDQAAVDRLKNAEFTGLYLSENVRIEIEVLARDNRWKRVPPDQATRDLGIYSSDPLVEATQILEQDPRSERDSFGKCDAPYLDVIAKTNIWDPNAPHTGQPGISWWVEETKEDLRDGGNGKAERDSDIEPSRQLFENAPWMIFRSGNYAGPDDPRTYDRFLRVMARDLLGNRTDIRIPIYVKTQDFSVSTLRTGTQRFGGGP